MNSLDEVAQAVRSCTDCPLHRGRTNAVPGEGSPSADVMFIGEGPGFHEDRQGRPFVGPAGQLLEGLLASIGTNRDEVFIANMVKCRPPDNRDPEPSEIAACGKFLERQIELINPRLIVTLGRFSLGRFFPGRASPGPAADCATKTDVPYSPSCTRPQPCGARNCARHWLKISGRFQRFSKPKISVRRSRKYPTAPFPQNPKAANWTSSVLLRPLLLRQSMKRRKIPPHPNKDGRMAHNNSLSSKVLGSTVFPQVTSISPVLTRQLVLQMSLFNAKVAVSLACDWGGGPTSRMVRPEHTRRSYPPDRAEEAMETKNRTSFTPL